MEKHQNFIDSGNDQDYRRFRTEPDGKSCLAMKGNYRPPSMACSMYVEAGKTLMSGPGLEIQVWYC